MSKNERSRSLCRLAMALGLLATPAHRGWSVTRSDATADQYAEPTRFQGNETWSGVGKIPVQLEFPRSGLGSGALISPCHVLTAAHVFFGSDGIGTHPPDPQKAKFTLVNPPQETTFEVDKINLGPGYDRSVGHRIRTPVMPRDNLTRNDIAIMKLKESVPEKIKVGAQEIPIEIYAVNKGQIDKENDPGLKTPAVDKANMVKVGFGARGNEAGRQVEAGVKGEMFNIVDDFGDGRTTFHIRPNPPDPDIRDNPPPKNTLLHDFDHLPAAGQKPQNSSWLLNTFTNPPRASFTVGPLEGSPAGGDSGGPTFQYKDGKKLITGVTSSGSDRLSRVGNVSYDTQVQKYKPWIEQTLRDGRDDGPVRCPPVKKQDGQREPRRYSGRGEGAKGTNQGQPFESVDTGPLPDVGGVILNESEAADFPGGCIGNCDGEHPSMGSNAAVFSTTRAEGSSSSATSMVSFVDVMADGYEIVADWLMPSARASCTESGGQTSADSSVGWVFIYDPEGNIVYSETTGLTQTVRVPLQGGEDGEVVINEVTSSVSPTSASLTLNGLHVKIGCADFVVASAHADVEDCPR